MQLRTKRKSKRSAPPPYVPTQTKKKKTSLSDEARLRKRGRSVYSTPAVAFLRCSSKQPLQSSLSTCKHTNAHDGVLLTQGRYFFFQLQTLPAIPQMHTPALWLDVADVC